MLPFEPQDADSLPLSLSNLFQSRVDHAEDLAPGRLLDLCLEQVGRVGRDNKEIGQTPHPLRGLEQARVWRLYLVGGALAFEQNRMGVDQILSVKTTVDGSGGMPATRLGWEPHASRGTPVTSLRP